MDGASLPDLSSLDRDALMALFRAQQAQQVKLDAMLAARDEQLRLLEAELEAQRKTLSEQADELRSSGDRIAHLKLLVEKLRHSLFGKKSEKLVLQLEQLELELEEEEIAHAELEAEAGRVPQLRRLKGAPNGSRFQNILNVKS
jgi:transposase